MSAESANRPLNIVFLDRATLSNSVTIRPFTFKSEVKIYEQTAADEVAQRIADADVVITNKTPVTAQSLAAAPNLKLIAVAATGTDIIDVPACSTRGITVCNIRNYAENTVPEHTFALVLALRRSIVEYSRSVRQGRWQESGMFCYFDHPINDLAGSTIGVVGDGVLGRAVADIARVFKMRVLFSAYKGTQNMGPLYTPFEQVLGESDIITLHSPLMPSTRNMISDGEFSIMSRRPLLINTARGGLVDEEALSRALRSGQISGAAFDVATAEPPCSNHVMMKLLEHPRFVLTPHVAWASQEAIQGLVDQLIENVELFLRGSPRNVVG